jgi:transposase
MVHGSFRSLSPAGLLIDDVEIGPDRIVIAARCRAVAGECPACGRQSGRVHSCYERRLLDLPSHGRPVRLRVAVRRFRCATPGCPRRIFAERLGEAVAGRSPGAHSGLKRLSAISALPWAAALPPPWRDG